MRISYGSKTIVTNSTRAEPRRFLELSDVVCPNETELALLCKGDIDPEDQKSVQAGARQLIARGTKYDKTSTR